MRVILCRLCRLGSARNARGSALALRVGLVGAMKRVSRTPYGMMLLAPSTMTLWPEK